MFESKLGWASSGTVNGEVEPPLALDETGHLP